MLVEVKYEYEKLSKNEFVFMKNMQTGETTKLHAPNERWKGTSFVEVADKTNATSIRMKVETYLETMNDAIKGSVVVKSMREVVVIKL